MNIVRDIFAPKFTDKAGQPVLVSWVMVGKEGLLFWALAFFVFAVLQFISTVSDFVVLTLSSALYIFVFHCFNRMSRTPISFANSVIVAFVGLRVFFFYLSILSILILLLQYTVDAGSEAGGAAIILLPFIGLAFFIIFPVILLSLGFFWTTIHHGLVWANRSAVIARWFTMIFVVIIPSVILLMVIMGNLVI
ncbi:MAG: hypothetical protein COV07_01165 [Candidatus Vogelbacteria bacterium CG10_big_fil_rev_8_21_14_0_10_45_14]|uniref:Yip1 domain-containing protein n=1 Tax=Candidatus Vogelbacteria bacterium CG10_big_fil_rev_8_21_14_0_10_45_14 TaxID=1975042 RepID=A0A2H0RM09_9BACT|nr:MAG: hypothetical protein COV07_01165 [Candidatus Vogelbacteria bacterium CG10_big_fil_rev_8_21_14_0_10_45_14]